MGLCFLNHIGQRLTDRLAVDDCLAVVTGDTVRLKATGIRNQLTTCCLYYMLKLQKEETPFCLIKVFWCSSLELGADHVGLFFQNERHNALEQ